MEMHDISDNSMIKIPILAVFCGQSAPYHAHSVQSFILRLSFDETPSELISELERVENQAVTEKLVTRAF
jgi:hypothetical protein